MMKMKAVCCTSMTSEKELGILNLCCGGAYCRTYSYSADQHFVVHIDFVVLIGRSKQWSGGRRIHDPF